MMTASAFLIQFNAKAMNRFLFLISMLTMPFGVFSQSSSLISPDSVSLVYPMSIDEEKQFEGSEATIGDDRPLGTITTDAVVAIKVGESSNGYSFILGENTQISAVSAADGDAIAFIYRQNISDCGGSTVKNGLLRYSISTNGGTIWNVSPSDLSYPGYQPDICYGLGPVNPGYEQVSRYPNLLLALPQEEAPLSEMIGVYQAAVLNEKFPSNSDFDGIVTGLVESPGDVPIVSQEEYLFQEEEQFYPNHLVERIPGEYWSVSWNVEDVPFGKEAGNILQLNRGVFNESTRKIHWQNAHRIPIDFQTYLVPGGVDSVEVRGTPSIAFSPDGATGYVGLNGDIGEKDSVYRPILLKTTNGGIAWSDPVEIDLTAFPALKDSLQAYWTILDSTSGQVIPAGNGIPTTAFSHDLVVDQHGHPHFFCVVGNSASNLQNGSIGMPHYGLVDNLEMVVCDITIDENEQFNVLVISEQATFCHEFGGILAENWEADTWIQASRSKDGSKVFFSWTDTDTTGKVGWKFNNEPNLITRGFDVNSLQATHSRNWTFDDQNWSGKAIMPKMAPVCLDDSVTYRLPVVMMDIPLNVGLVAPVSYWYFNNISYSASDFSEQLFYVNDCEQIPISLTANVIVPGCHSANGNINIQATGGNGTLDQLWKTSTGNIFSPLPYTFSSGIYQVVVSDEIGCEADTVIVLNEESAPSLVLDSVSAIRCYGEVNGVASIMAIPDSGKTISSYLWSNGEAAAMASKLAGGVHTVRVVDSEGCSSWLEVEVDEPEPLEVEIIHEPIACHDEENGFLAAFGTGGTGKLSYEWSSGEQTTSIAMLDEGTYVMRVTDQQGCTNQAQHVVVNPEKLELALFGNDNVASQAPYNGFATASFTGGAPPVTFDWTGPDGFVGSSNIIFGLNGGEYFVTAKDQNGCIIRDSVEIKGYIWYFLAESEPQTAGISTFSISPNPNSGVFGLSLEFIRPLDVSIEILNPRGKLVSHMEEEQVSIIQKEIDLQAQPSGIYFVRVSTQNGSFGKKILIK